MELIDRGVPLRLISSVRSLEAEFPRKLLQRLVLGRGVDTAAPQPLSGLAPLPEALGPVLGLMVLAPPSHGRPPWETEPPLLPGEENPLTLARALKDWWAAEGPSHPGAMVGTDASVSAASNVPKTGSTTDRLTCT